MKESLFRITVLLSTYNHRRFVPSKLRQIRRQTLFDHSEFIFIETDSPEREREALAPFCEAHHNARLIALDQRLSLYGAWNKGWSEARAPLVCYSNMDDIMHPVLLETVVAAMTEKRLDLLTVLSARQPVESGIDDWNPAHIASLRLNKRPGGPFTAWRNDVADRMGRFDEDYFLAGDKEFWSRAHRASLRWGLVPRILYLFSDDPGSLGKVAREDPRRVSDRRRITESPHPVRWPPGLKRKMRLIRFISKFAPARYTVPTPGACRAKDEGSLGP